MNDENAPPAQLQKTVSANQMGLSFLSKERQEVADSSRTQHEETVAHGGAALAEAWDAYLAWAEAHREYTPHPLPQRRWFRRSYF